MRTLIDLDESLVRDLDNVARAAKRSRASLIRQAVVEFLGESRKEIEGEAFGLWGKREIDGLDYQRKLRAEW
jgi:metal-responsive CopG/Arc/MetJ family transcriptional regulator